MCKVATYSGLVLGNEMNGEQEIIDSIKAREMAQAVLAEARYRKEEAKKKIRDTGQESETAERQEEEQQTQVLQIDEGMGGPSDSDSNKTKKPRKMVQKRRGAAKDRKK